MKVKKSNHKNATEEIQRQQGQEEEEMKYQRMVEIHSMHPELCKYKERLLFLETIGADATILCFKPGMDASLMIQIIDTLYFYHGNKCIMREAYPHLYESHNSAPNTNADVEMEVNDRQEKISFGAIDLIKWLHVLTETGRFKITREFLPSSTLDKVREIIFDTVDDEAEGDTSCESLLSKFK